MTVSRTICLGFLAVITIGAVLLTLPVSVAGGHWGSPLVALFTSTSAVCVTGLSVVDVGKYFTVFGQVVLVLLAQVGGLGYMTATTVILLILRRRLGLRDKVAIQQALDVTGLSGLSGLVKSIIATTLIFELIGTVLMFPVFLDAQGLPTDPKLWPSFLQTGEYTPLKAAWLAIFYSVSAFNNAGFGLFADNLASYVRSVPISLVISGLIIFGGIGYQTLMEGYCWTRHAVAQKPGKFLFSLNYKIVISSTLLLLVMGTLAFLLTEWNNPATLASLDWHHRLLAAWFQSVTPRTAGFNTIDISKMTVTGLFLTIGLMFVGASPGGTGGGIKTTTFRVLINTTKAVLQGKEEVLCYHRQIPPALILKAIAVVIGSALTVLTATNLITLSDPNQSFINIFFEVVSAFATVGLSALGTANLSANGQILLIAVMYIGRVGVLLLMGALLGDPKPSFVKYPEENLLVG
jgi:trk system potassium uptake protein TrkH